ncbi:hypothetical protein ACI2J5_25240 [Agrobacterium pusense]|uniref:hypothetical protein n=1 Tax=Agrobacterium pusense TaxID=648995 RepID=UPI0038509EFA
MSKVQRVAQFWPLPADHDIRDGITISVLFAMVVGYPRDILVAQCTIAKRAKRRGLVFSHVFGRDSLLYLVAGGFQPVWALAALPTYPLGLPLGR